MKIRKETLTSDEVIQWLQQWDDEYVSGNSHNDQTRVKAARVHILPIVEWLEKNHWTENPDAPPQDEDKEPTLDWNELD